MKGVLRFTKDVDRSMFFVFKKEENKLFIFLYAGETTLADVVLWIQRGKQFSDIG